VSTTSLVLVEATGTSTNMAPAMTAVKRPSKAWRSSSTSCAKLLLDAFSPIEPQSHAHDAGYLATRRE
jgi:hypothetical protein